ncbi:MAG: peptidyl-prolyl cis-trans isomerase [Opitutae bacterium]|nr:peptidyl-prolyl cis-trans isomerase [Opitutae bacterium]
MHGDLPPRGAGRAPEQPQQRRPHDLVFPHRQRPYGIPRRFSIRILASTRPVVLSSPPMNRLLPLLALALWTSAARAPAAPATPAAGVLLDSYAAIVNGKVITVGDVLSALQPVQARLAAQYEGGELEQKILEAYDKARNSLIESELILLDFEMQGGALPDRAVEDHVNTVIHERFDNDRTSFLRALAAERLTFSEWRKQMKEQLVVQIMRQKEVSAKILITPLDLQTAYARQRDAFALPERVRLRTLAFPSGRDAEAARLRERILAGELAFTDAADDAATLQDDPEFLDLSSLHESIRAALAPLAPGGISPPLAIEDGLYLIQLVQRQEARVQPLDEVSPQIEKELRRAEFDRLNRVWIDALRSKYFIQTFSHHLFD